MTREYKDLSAFEADEMKDWRDANYFASKALAAAGGQTVAPQDPGERDLPQDVLPEIQSVRQRLLTALDGGARENKAEVAARAQARFDCWLEQQEENFQNDHISACRDELLAALAELEAKPAEPAPAPAPAPQVYLVLFDFDKSNINPAAQAVINRVVADFSANKAKAISITGYTDRSGTDAYNLKLSERRADAALIHHCGDLVQQRVLRVHVGGLEGGAREHRPPVQRCALALELGDIERLRIIDQAELALRCDHLADRLEVLA